VMQRAIEYQRTKYLFPLAMQPTPPANFGSTAVPAAMR